MRLFSRAALALLGALVLAPIVSAQAPTLQPTDLFQLQYATDPAISPDGQWIVYVRRWNDVMTDRRYSNLWIVKPDGSEHRPLTTGKVNDGSPALVAGREAARLRLRPRAATPRSTSAGWTPASPIRSPTSPSRRRRRPGRRTARSSPSSSWCPPRHWWSGTPLHAPPGAEWAPPPKYDDRLVFRFDGVGELPTGFIHAFVVSADGGSPRQVTSGDFNYGGLFFIGGDVTWSRDGSELVLPARRGDRPEFNWRETDLYAFSVKTGAMRQLTDRFGPDQSPAVSPDGKLIAWVGYDDHKQGYQNTLLSVMNADGSGKRVLSTKLDQSVGNPRWSADGKWVYVSFDQQGDTKVARFALDGSYQVVAEHLGANGSAYMGGSYDVGPTGAVAFTMSTPDQPSELAYTGGAPGAPVKTLTALNADLLAGRTLGQVEEIWYPSSKDGRKIQGWIIKPPGFDPSRKYPFILEIHGGPFANYGDRLRRGEAADGGGGLRGALRQPAGQHQLRRGVREPDPPRLSG